MRDGLSSEFIGKLNATKRRPVLMLDLHFSDGDVFLADRPIGVKEGFQNEYLPLVESWGELVDNVDRQLVYKGQSLETRQVSINVINTEFPPFSSYFNDNPPENVVADLYLWFSDTLASERVLVDKFILQDPIVINEGSAVVSIAMVSVIMRSNPFLWGPEAASKRYPLVLGKVEGLVATYDGANPIAIVDADFAATYTGIIYVDSTEGFPNTGTLVIDSENLTYDTRFPGAFNITARGVNSTTDRPHTRGALVLRDGDNFDYRVCGGPVQSIDNLVGDGTPYANDYTVFAGENPAFVRFPGRPPWHQATSTPGGSVPQPPEVTNQYGASNETANSIVSAPSSCANINNSESAGTVAFAIDNTIGGDKTATYYGLSYTSGETGSYINLNTNLASINHNYSPSGGYNGVRGGFVDMNTSNLPELPGTFYFIESTFGRNLASLGTFRGASISITHGWIARSYNGYFRIVLTINGTEQTIWQASFFATGRATVERPQVTSSFDIGALGVSSWADLQSVKVRLEIELTAADPKSSTCPAGQICHWQLSTSWSGGVSVIPVWRDSTSNPTYPYQECISHFNRDLSSLGTLNSVQCKLRFNAINYSTTTTQFIVYRSTSDHADNSSLWSRQSSGTEAEAEFIVTVPAASWTALKNARVGLLAHIDGPASPGDRRRHYSTLKYCQWVINYTPSDIVLPDEERIVYVDELMVDVVGQGGENVTPAQALQRILEAPGALNDFVDYDDFLAVHLSYDSEGYYLNGLIPGDMRFHDAVKDILRQGLARIIYNAGYIKMRRYIRQADYPAPARTFTKSDLLLRGMIEERLPLDYLKNDITINYKPDVNEGTWLGVIQKTDDPSIAQFGDQQDLIEFGLIRDDTIADYIVDTYLERQSRPISWTTFRAFLKAFPLEKLDRVKLETDFNNYLNLSGSIHSMSWRFGSGKNKQINLFSVLLETAGSESEAIAISDGIIIDDSFVWFAITRAINIADAIEIDDSNIYFLKFGPFSDAIEIDDANLTLDSPVSGYGIGAYGNQGGYGL